MSNIFGKIGGALKRTKEYPIVPYKGGGGGYSGGILGNLKSGFNKVRKFYNNVNAASGGQIGNMLFKGISNAAEATKYIPGYGSAIHTTTKTVGKILRKSTQRETAHHDIGRALTGKHASKHLGKDSASNNMPKISSMKQHTSPAPSGVGLSNNNITATSR